MRLSTAVDLLMWFFSVTDISNLKPYIYIYIYMQPDFLRSPTVISCGCTVCVIWNFWNILKILIAYHSWTSTNRYDLAQHITFSNTIRSVVRCGIGRRLNPQNRPKPAFFTSWLWVPIVITSEKVIELYWKAPVQCLCTIDTVPRG